MNAQLQTRRITKPALNPSYMPISRGLLQRACACGQHTHGVGECDSCRKKRESLQRQSLSPIPYPLKDQGKRDRGQGDLAPPVVHEVLRSPGQPLDAATRAFMEPRFGREFSQVPVKPVPQQKSNGLEIGPENDRFEREADRTAKGVLRPDRSHFQAAFPPSRGADFSRVRIHTGARAAESAQAVGARAYTVGQDVVFGEGQYAPQTGPGRELLAHELTHVLQQGTGPGIQRQTLQREGGTFGGFFSNIGRAIAEFFGAEGGFDQETLQAYLRTLDESGDIEDDFDSDNKARAIANAWRLGGSPYVLTAQRKALMIRELLKGVTGGDDEMAILELLERSYNFELSYIFGAGGVKADVLNDNFSGENMDRLRNFYSRRFRKGEEALHKGEVQPRGLPVPLGQSLGALGSWMVEDLPGAKPEWNVECLLGILCTQDKAVVDQLPKMKVVIATKVIEVYWEYDGTSWNERTRTRGAFARKWLKEIGLKASHDCATAASNIFHEVRHQNQPDSWTPVEKELDAYTFQEDWTIQRGLPGRALFRTKKPGTQEEIPNKEAIEAYVEERYSGGTDVEDEVIIGHTSDGKTKVRKPDDTEYTRPPVEGDSHQDVDKTEANLSNLPKVDPSRWACPKAK